MYARMLLEAAIGHAKAEYKAAKQSGEVLPDRRVLAVFYVKCELESNRKQRKYRQAFDCYALLEAMREAQTLTSLLESLVAVERGSVPEGPVTVIPGQNPRKAEDEPQVSSHLENSAHNNNDTISADHQLDITCFVAGVLR